MCQNNVKVDEYYLFVCIYENVKIRVLFYVHPFNSEEKTFILDQHDNLDIKRKQLRNQPDRIGSRVDMSMKLIGNVFDSLSNFGMDRS